ncbi:hypothetical protein M501DRAFT_962692 [Patellaria atrata CBS 101060]|uniref:Uncharacterized protein n=1 Tax=Patellaria atrata CBS 101060 TaxID=1346257 RepID=A0A9P4S330_9PEZI|nr:hypothetical protein M501DRAFT_962692 [Patellaria atrata CBS 101060]
MANDLPFSPTCPSGGDWYVCADGSSFLGCCTSDPCNRGCPSTDLRPASFDRNFFGEFHDQQCSSGDYYTCASNDPPFLGCCHSNPCTQGRCPDDDLTAAFLSNNPSFAADFLVEQNATSTASETTASSTSSATSTSTSPPNSDDDDGGFPVAGIVGAAVGGVVVIIVALVIFYIHRRRKRRDVRVPHTASHEGVIPPPMAEQTTSPNRERYSEMPADTITPSKNFRDSDQTIWSPSSYHASQTQTSKTNLSPEMQHSSYYPSPDPSHLSHPSMGEPFRASQQQFLAELPAESLAPGVGASPAQDGMRESYQSPVSAGTPGSWRPGYI